MAHQPTAVIERFLAQHGIHNYRLSRTAGDHGRVTVTHGGRTRFVVYPLTPGDHRSMLNVLAALRHEFGLVGVNTRAKSTRQRRTANTAARHSRVVLPAIAAAPPRRHDQYQDVLAALLPEGGR